MDQAIILVRRKTKTLSGQITAKDANSSLQVFVKAWKFQMQLQTAPKAVLGLSRVTRAYQKVQRRAVLSQQVAGRTRLQRTPFDQGISPPAQGRNVNIDPVIPPVECPGVVAEEFLFFRNQRVGKLFHILRNKIVLIVQDERLEQLNEFFYP